MTATTTDHLTTVITHWGDLTDMLTTHHGAPWPPAARMRDHLAHLTATERDERAQARMDERADSTPDALGEAPAPIRLTILDTIREVEQQLVRLTDVIASEVQQPAMTHAPAHWLPAEQEHRNQLADRDAADPRRWNYRGHRAAWQAAVWLLARLEGRGGPFIPLRATHREQIAQAAEQAADRVQRALNLVRDAHALEEPCPHCRSLLLLHSGDGQPPAVECVGCGRTWTAADAAA